MIKAYHRPETLEQALSLLNRPETIPLGGGTVINTPAFKEKDLEVVDLQLLGLNHIHKKGSMLEIGAAVTLQQLLENPHTPAALQQAIRQEAPINIRNAATIAGSLVSCNGRSPFATAMLALDAALHFHETEKRSLGSFLPLRPAGLILAISIPLNARLACQQVARTPADLPIVCAAVSQWSSGRTRLALGGTGLSPLLALDGTEAEGLEAAARNTFHQAADAWASAEYRQDTAAVLAKRCLAEIQALSAAEE